MLKRSEEDEAFSIIDSDFREVEYRDCNYCDEIDINYFFRPSNTTGIIKIYTF